MTAKIEGRKDDDLLDRKGGMGWPFIVFLDAEGGVVAELPGDRRTVEGMRETAAKDVARFLDLRGRAAKGDAGAVTDFALLEGALGRITVADLDKRLAGKTLSAEQQKTRQGVQANAAIKEVLGELMKGRQGPDAMAEMGRKLRVVHDAGGAPTNDQLKFYFYNILMQYAHQERDPKLARGALDGIRPLLPADDAREWIQAQERRIEDLEADLAEDAEAPDDDEEDEEIEEDEG